MLTNGMIDFNVTRAEQKTITAIVKRAAKDGLLERIGGTFMDLDMDLCAVHRDTPLRLDDLLNADAFNFAHDIAGIRRHIDRTNGTLTDCFLPRYAKPQPKDEYPNPVATMKRFVDALAKHICGEPVPDMGQSLCTRPMGHEGDHRCSAADVDARAAKV